MRPLSSFRKDNRGAVAAITIIMMVVFFALLAIVVDLGHLMLVRNQLQNAADAGALAGAGALAPYTSTGTPNWTAGQTAATGTVQSNKADTYTLQTASVQAGVWNTTWTPATAPPNLLSQGTTLDSTHVPAVKVSVQKIAGSNNGPVALTFGQIFGISTVNVGAHASAIVTNQAAGGGGGPFNFTLFSNLPFLINGTNKITGSVGSNGLLHINGGETIIGTAYGAGGVFVQGSETIGSIVADTVQDISMQDSAFKGTESGGATNIPLPDYSSQIAATAATVYNGNQSFNNINSSGNIYVNGNVTLNGALEFTGAILATGNISINGPVTITGSNQVFIYSANGTITINGTENLAPIGSNANVIVYAPNGSAILNGPFTLNGIVVANQINVNGPENFNGNFPIVTLPLQQGVPELVQ